MDSITLFRPKEQKEILTFTDELAEELYKLVT